MHDAEWPEVTVTKVERDVQTGQGGRAGNQQEGRKVNRTKDCRAESDQDKPMLVEEWDAFEVTNHDPHNQELLNNAPDGVE